METIKCEFIPPTKAIDRIILDLPRKWSRARIIKAYMFFNNKNYLRVFKEKNIELTILGKIFEDNVSLEAHLEKHVC